MNFIITGHCGLIGTALKERLEQQGNRCILKMDLRDGDDICYDLPLPSLKYEADILFHLSANCKINKCIENPEWAFENVIGIHKVLEFCRKNNIKKIITFSSSRVLSKERNPYTAAKIYMEELCKGYSASYGIKYLIIRPSTVYGGEHHDLTMRLITKWIINALINKPLYIYGDKEKTLDFTHVDDFVDGIIILLDNWDKAKNDSYSICGNDCRRLVDVYEEIIRQTESKSELVFKSPEIAQPQQIKISIENIKKYGYSPKIKLEDGIKRLISFYQNEGKKWLE